MPRLQGPVFRPGRVRDALGLVRLLWALEKDAGVAPDEDGLAVHLQRMNVLTSVGETLVASLELGIDMADRPESLGYRAAITRSEEALRRLRREYAGHPLVDLVVLAEERACGPKPRDPWAGEERKKARMLRG